MAEIKGLRKVLANLRKEIKKVKKGGKKGLIRLGLEIKGISMRGVPIEFGNLRASHYVAWKGGVDNRPVWHSARSQDHVWQLATEHNYIVGQATAALANNAVEVGVSAFYAAKQHEELGFKHTVGGPRFLIKALENVTPRAEKIVAQDAKIKGG